MFWNDHCITFILSFGQITLLLLHSGLLEKVVLCVEEISTGIRLEQFVWEIYFDLAVSPGCPAGSFSRVHTEPKSQEELEDALRQVFFVS